MKSNNSLSRRNFLKHSALAVGSVSILSKIICNDSHSIFDSNEAFAQALAPVDENNPTALALGFKHDASLVDPVKFPRHATEPASKGTCSGCMFYSQGGQKIEGNAGDFGKCTLFPAGLVNAKGWCNSWTLKPGTTL